MKITGSVIKFQAVQMLTLGLSHLEAEAELKNLSVAIWYSKNLLVHQGHLVDLQLQGVQPLLLDQVGLFLLSHQVLHFVPVEKLYCYITTQKMQFVSFWWETLSRYSSEGNMNTKINVNAAAFCWCTSRGREG